MPWDSEFDSMMNQFVVVRPFVSEDAYGEATYGTGIEYRCYIDSEPRQIIDQEGQTVVSNTKIYFAGPQPITLKDVVILPDEAGDDPPRERPIISVSTLYDDVSPHHTEVHV